MGVMRIVFGILSYKSHRSVYVACKRVFHLILTRFWPDLSAFLFVKKTSSCKTN